MIHRLGITVRYFERMKFCFKHFSLGRGTIYLKNGFFVKKNIKLMLARWGPHHGALSQFNQVRERATQPKPLVKRLGVHQKTHA